MKKSGDDLLNDGLVNNDLMNNDLIDMIKVLGE